MFVIIFSYLYWFLFSFESNDYLYNNKESIVNIEKEVNSYPLLVEENFESNVLEKLLKNDYFLDSSIFKYVDNKVSYNNKEYLPDNLVTLSWSFLYDSKKNSRLRVVALNSLKNLSKEYHNKFWIKLKVVSAYRSYLYQKWIKDRGCSDLFCAKAWFSEHQSGLAVDFWEATTEERYKNNDKLKLYFEWMKVNWPKFWFTNTYQKWRDVDWYSIEPWHWRYVWKDLSIYLYDNNLTFSEFYYSNIFIKG